MPNMKLEIVKVNSFLKDVKQKDATNVCGQIKGKSQVPETYVQTHDHMLYTGNCKNEDEPYLYLYLYRESLPVIKASRTFYIAALYLLPHPSSSYKLIETQVINNDILTRGSYPHKKDIHTLPASLLSHTSLFTFLQSSHFHLINQSFIIC